MMIVDSQLHIWAADTPERPWPPGQAARAHQPTPLTAEKLLEKNGCRRRDARHPRAALLGG